MRRIADHPRSNHAGRGALLVLGGAVMGAAVGLLAAPQSGARTRRRIARTAEDAKEQVAELCDDVTEKVEEMRRGVAGRLAGGKKYVDQARRAWLANAPALPTPLGRLLHTLRG